MLTFNPKGLLIPDTNIVSSVAGLKKHFVQNIPTATRQENFEKYIKYSDELKYLLSGMALRQWINGSFVTQIQNPKDIDIVTFIDHNIVVEFREQLDTFGVKGAWKTYGVDAYIVEILPQDHPKYFFYKSDITYWMAKFGKTRRGLDGQRNRKGFLEIIY